jgi:hypothetical protein
MPFAHAFCTCLLHMPFAHAFCTCHLHMPFAHAFCTCLLRMPFAHAICTCLLHMPFAHAFCTCLLHMPFAHAFCACLLRMPFAQKHVPPVMHGCLTLWRRSSSILVVRWTRLRLPLPHRARGDGCRRRKRMLWIAPGGCSVASS